MDLRSTIGLEIHAELKTRTKMFCGCPNDPDEKHPNVNVCPVCLGHPGTLPVINYDAVAAVLKLGLAVGSEIAPDSHFDRKSYFYPDLPKAYQISQYENPLVRKGMINGIRIRRIHLEEDTGRLIHPLEISKESVEEFKQPPSGFIKLKPGAPIRHAAFSWVDFNRAGVPLMELVTEPDIKSAEEAVRFAKELQLLLRYLEISDADMEKGQMRVEANVSLDMGTKVELKNINSFRAVRDAIEYELKRQEGVLVGGGELVQETRGWDEKKGATKLQRVKESAHDYRYFPEPDLPPLDLSGIDLEKIRLEIPELPEGKRSRFMKEYGLSAEQVEVLTADRFAAQYFEEATSELLALSDSQAAAFNLLYNYFTSDLWGLMASNNVGLKDLKITPENFAELVFLAGKGDISSRMAKDALLKMFQTGADPSELIKESGGAQIKDEADLETMIKEAIAENPAAVEDFKKGKQNALQFLIGQVMKKSKGRADPEVLRKIFEKLL